MTSSEITQQDSLTVLPAQRPAQPDAVAQLMQHAQAMSAAKQLADALCSSDLVPALYKGNPGNGAAAILYGAELGLNPIQSLQQVFVVHGSPAVYARTMVALLKSRGYLIETVSSSDTAVTVRGTDPRTGEVEESEWTIERATKAGYTSNKKYETDPRGMLYAKSASEVCRRLAPQVLLGISYSREEMEMEAAAHPRYVASTNARTDVAEDLRARLTAAPEREAVPEPDEVVTDVSHGVEAITDAQLRKLNILLTKEGFADRGEKIDWLRGNLKRDEIKSSKDVTKAEASALIKFLENAQAEDSNKDAD